MACCACPYAEYYNFIILNIRARSFTKDYSIKGIRLLQRIFTGLLF